MLPSNVVVFHHGQRWRPRCCVPSWGHNNFSVCLASVLFLLLLLAKYYAIFSDPTIFFCFTYSSWEPWRFFRVSLETSSKSTTYGHWRCCRETRSHVKRLKTNKTIVDHNVLSLYHSFSTQNPVLRHTKVNKWEEVENWELIHKNYSLYDLVQSKTFCWRHTGGSRIFSIQLTFSTLDVLQLIKGRSGR